MVELWHRSEFLFLLLPSTTAGSIPSAAALGKALCQVVQL